AAPAASARPASSPTASVSTAPGDDGEVGATAGSTTLIATGGCAVGASGFSSSVTRLVMVAPSVFATASALPGDGPVTAKLISTESGGLVAVTRSATSFGETSRPNCATTSLVTLGLVTSPLYEA